MTTTDRISADPSRGDRSRVGLVEACDDERLFGFPLWPKQRELLKAVEAGPRLHVWALGRRSGKTTMAALVLLHGLLFRPDLDAKMRPGERRYAVAIATNIAQARVLVRAAASIIEHSPLLAQLADSITEDAITFSNDTELRAFPCSSRGGRGWAISHFAMDEAAHFLTETDGYQTAERVWQALMPSTAQFGEGARVIVSSTPFGTDGLFAQLHQQAASGDLDAHALHAATQEINPTIDRAFLAREEQRDPESFRGEYLAEFLASGNAYLDLDRVQIAERGPLPPEAARGWIAGLDPAFSRDPFGIALVGRDPQDSKRLVLGYADALKPSKWRGGFDAKLAEVIEVLERYGVSEVVTDQYAAEAIIDRLRSAGFYVEKVHLSATIKTQGFAELRARLYNGTLELYEHAGLVAELRRLRTRFSVGQAAVENPRVGGSHGDMAQALALAVNRFAELGSGEVGVGPVLYGPGLAGALDPDDLPIHMRFGSDPDSPHHRKWSRYNFCLCHKCEAERKAIGAEDDSPPVLWR